MGLQIHVHYTGSVRDGVTLFYGKRHTKQGVSAQQFDALIHQFRGRTVNIGTSRTDRSSGSVGAWLKLNVARPAIASYVGRILVAEGYADKVRRSTIRFKTT